MKKSFLSQYESYTRQKAQAFHKNKQQEFKKKILELIGNVSLFNKKIKMFQKDFEKKYVDFQYISNIRNLIVTLEILEKEITCLEAEDSRSILKDQTKRLGRFKQYLHECIESQSRGLTAQNCLQTHVRKLTTEFRQFLYELHQHPYLTNDVIISDNNNSSSLSLTTPFSGTSKTVSSPNTETILNMNEITIGNFENLNNFPIDFLVKIFSYLPPENIVLIALVCKKFKEAARNNSLWREKLQLNFFMLPRPLPSNVSRLDNTLYYKKFRSSYINKYGYPKTKYSLSSEMKKKFSLVKEGRVVELITIGVSFVDLGCPDQSWNTLLDYAEATNNEELLNNFFDIALSYYNSNGLEKFDRCGRSVLQWAAHCRQSRKIIQELISRGAIVDATAWEAPTALAIAVRNHLEDTVKVLLENGANPNFMRGSGITPLSIAAKSGNRNILELLLQKGGHLNISDDEKILFDAAAAGQHEAIDLLLQHGAKIDGLSRFDKNSTALYFASERGDLETVKFLLARKANVEQGFLIYHQKIKYNSTPLYVAAIKGHLPVILALLEKDADIDVCVCGQTPIFAATSGGHFSTVKALFEYGAETDPVTENGPTLLQIAQAKGHTEIIHFLRKTLTSDDADNITHLNMRA